MNKRANFIWISSGKKYTKNTVCIYVINAESHFHQMARKRWNKLGEVSKYMTQSTLMGCGNSKGGKVGFEIVLINLFERIQPRLLPLCSK